MNSQQIATSYLNSELMECPSLLKSNKEMILVNKPQANKVVSKKFGDVKKISLFERAKRVV